METLPDELVLEILGYLVAQELDRNRCFIWALSLVNKRFYRLLKSHLYGTYAFRLGHPESFLRTISSSSELAQCVKHITWGYQDSSYPFQFFDLLSIAEKERIAANIRAFGTVSANELADAFPDLTIGAHSHTADEQAYLSALLMFTPNIKVLDIAGFGVHSWKGSTHWLKPVADHAHLFANLVEVKVAGPMRIRHVLPLFTIPSLQTLKLDYLTTNREPAPLNTELPWGVDSESSQILREKGSFLKHFHVAHCYTGTADIIPLLKAFRCLKTFDFENVEGSEDKKFQSLLISIVQHCSSLEALRLRDWSTVPDIGVLKVLRDLKDLHSLDLDVYCFFPRHEQTTDPEALTAFLRYLPRNVQHLALQANNDDDDDDDVPSNTFAHTLQTLAPTIRTSLPALRKLAIVDWDPLRCIFPCQIQLKDLQNAFAGAGVEFTSRSGDTLGDDLVSLDYVEPGWVWVQSVSGENGTWLKDLENDEYMLSCKTWGWEEEDEWVWIYVDELPRLEPEMAMSQYLAEQPIWYWGELQNGHT
ncbi:uncharacterized protein K460DRAFT_363425 [Cucurbitaria berberidis CBS 394.84]|uniref:F-box domain-containing protein n=1 Tax=Cucurbitaria berberidis CBS 394.84 TaxID=1168544 RepID=A0A9P4GKM7_9PLEO|nr:uncharacterized protein K460DRAFT_363425 [Cucurbitaria berberidis CBS 394.84]KAF1847335.1 hypothetical protein K460DRAFT_363425 [Cucurbitaria berberidis CBS 394.84]